MATRQRRQSKLRPLILPAICLAATAYFAVHAYHGSSGVLARAAIDARIADLKTELAAVTEVREQMEKKVRLLRAASVERDMLDERARALLGFASANEVVVMRTASQH